MKTKIDDGGQAFPVPNSEYLPAYGGAPGMSLRDWFAGQALVGLMAHTFDDGSDFLNEMGPEAAAHQSYRMADAMLAARKGAE